MGSAAGPAIVCADKMRFNLLGALFLLPFHAGEIQHGCFVKQDRVSAGANLNSKRGAPNFNVTKCALACAKNRECDTFHVDGGKNCFLKKAGSIQKTFFRMPGGAAAGFCPKSKASYDSNGITLKPSYSPLKCSKREKSKVCQFPIVFKGEVKWDCIEETAGSVCNVKPSSGLQVFQDARKFHECGECSSDVNSGFSHYNGFRLLNHGGKNYYKGLDTKDDCQVLCDLAGGCNFFNYNTESKSCFLKFGVGQRKNGPGIVFGKKVQQVHPRKNDLDGDRDEQTTEKIIDTGTFVYWGLVSIPVLMTLVGLIYMFKTNCNLKRKCSDMFGLCKSLEKTDINTVYGEEYYADGCMEAQDHNSAYYSITEENSICTRSMDNNSQYEEM